MSVSLPPLPSPEGLTPNYMAQLAARNKAALKVPEGWMEALADKGWLFAGANEYYLFWERPGYWLRVSTFEDGWRASIIPEDRRVPRPELGVAGVFIPFPEAMRAPEYRGLGAKAKAGAAASAMWEHHEKYLAKLGIKLTQVASKVFKGTGQGGYVSAQSFFFEGRKGC